MHANKDAFFEEIRDADNNISILYQPNKMANCTSHFHSNIEITYVQSGSVLATVNDDTYTLTGGDICLSLSYEVHSIEVPDDCICYTLLIPADIAPDFISITFEKKLVSNRISKSNNSEVIHKLLLELLDGGNILAQKGRVYLILSMLINSVTLTDAPKSQTKGQIIAPVLEYIGRNYRNDIKLCDVARHLGYTDTYLSTVFNSTLKCSFNQYLNSIRIRYAFPLLVSGNKSIMEIAIESGFNCTKTFVRAFKKIYNVPPRELIGNHTYGILKVIIGTPAQSTVFESTITLLQDGNWHSVEIPLSQFLSNDFSSTPNMVKYIHLKAAKDFHLTNGNCIDISHIKIVSIDDSGHSINLWANHGICTDSIANSNNKYMTVNTVQSEGSSFLRFTLTNADMFNSALSGIRVFDEKDGIADSFGHLDKSWILITMRLPNKVSGNFNNNRQ